MKKAVLLFLVAFLLIGFPRLITAQDLGSLQQAEIKKQVDAVFTEMVTCAEQLNYDKLTEGVDDRYHAGFIVNNVLYSDYASLIDVVKSGSQRVSEQNISINDKKITVLADNLVLLITSGIADVTLNDGTQFNANFYWSFVYQKFGDQWKVIHSHQSRTS